jgi:hypothetical protein
MNSYFDLFGLLSRFLSKLNRENTNKTKRENYNKQEDDDEEEEDDKK